jgi:signal transduction histidine kinase/ActR/RegA family two-component response regulator
MRPFRDLPIARKTLTLGLVPAIFALLVVILASLLSTYMTARRNQRADVESQATVVADNAGAGLVFGDRQMVDEIVRALRVRPNIDMVCVYDQNGALFSHFRRPSFDCPARWPAATPATVPVAVKPAMAGDDPVGTVYIRGNYSNLMNWMRQQSIVGFLALVCGFLAAAGLTHYVQRYLSTPIVELASTLDEVAASGDYSTRVEQRTGDEVGRLVRSFNTMLGVIQKKDTERNELLQKSLESNRIKDEFLATVSHELRTPLNAMLGWLQIIRTTDMDPATVQRALASIERNAQSQARVVEDLIELSRVVTGKLQLRTKPMDLRTVVEAALDVVRTAAAARGVSIQSKLSVSPAIVSGDRDRLQQVVWNLMSNAVKFTPSGGTVTVELDGDSRNCSIVVTDTGIGISPEFLPYIFERFRQADQSTTREHGGLGLGLAIAKEITELHGGVLKASSGGRGQGARFTLSLPRLIDAEAAAARFEAVEQPNLAGKRILVVDDDPDSREIATRALTGTGAAVTQAESGGEALELWRKRPFDVLICDLAMPGMDGYEVIRNIRRTALSDAHLPRAIALTALASDSDRQAVLDAGFDDHIVKPFDFHDLLRAVTKPA